MLAHQENRTRARAGLSKRTFSTMSTTAQNSRFRATRLCKRDMSELRMQMTQSSVYLEDKNKVQSQP